MPTEPALLGACIRLCRCFHRGNGERDDSEVGNDERDDSEVGNRVNTAFIMDWCELTRVTCPLFVAQESEGQVERGRG